MMGMRYKTYYYRCTPNACLSATGVAKCFSLNFKPTPSRFISELNHSPTRGRRMFLGGNMRYCLLLKRWMDIISFFKLKQNHPLIQTRNGPYSKIGPLISDKVSEISGVDHYQQISWFHGITSRYA